MRNAPAIIALAVALAASAVGCAGAHRTYRRDAFGPARTMAVACVCYDRRLLAMSDSDEVPYLQDDANTVRGSADAILAVTKGRVLDALARTELFALLPEEQVLSAIGAEVAVERPPRCVPAPGYPRPRTRSDASAIAGQLGVDAVMIIWMYFGVHVTGADYGLDAAGAARAHVVFSVAATDRDGRVIWGDTVTGRSPNALSSRWSALDEQQLFTPLQEAAAEATERLVSNLREQVGR